MTPSTTEVSLFFILRLFAPFHASLRHLHTCQLQKQTDPAKTGLVRYLVSKSHGSETCNYVTAASRGFFFSLSRGSRSRLRRSQSQLRYEKKKPSGTQGILGSKTDEIYFSSRRSSRNLTLTWEYNGRGEVCGLSDMSKYGNLNAPSLAAYVRASPLPGDQEFRLNGLAIHSRLANACQPLVDVSKLKFQGDKIALISLDELLWPVCTLQDLATNAQNAGYSVLIYNAWHIDDNGTQTDTKDKLLIPVLNTSYCELSSADRRNVYINIQTDDLINMRWYLERLYCWLLLGPVITLEWLRRRKRLCFMSGAPQQDDEESAIEDEESVGEGGLRSEAQETVANYDQETENDQTGDEEEPLIVVVSDAPANRMTATSHGTSTRVVVFFRKIFGKLAVGSGYVILIAVALPVGISSGGLSFFSI